MSSLTKAYIGVYHIHMVKCTYVLERRKLEFYVENAVKNMEFKFAIKMSFYTSCFCTVKCFLLFVICTY